MKEEFDFIAVGDIVGDVFIHLKNAEVHCRIDSEKCEICMNFGDKIPYEFAEECMAVGNSPNASVSASRLGLKTALVSNLGDDTIGKRCLATLEHEKVATNFVSVHGGMQTNYHYVLWFQDDRTILIKHYDYPYRLPDIGNPKWIYLSSLGEESLPYHQEILAYLQTHSSIKLSFQPGTFQIKLGSEKLKRLYEHCELFFCNKQEAQRILGNREENMSRLLRDIHALGPKIPVITDGVKGAYTYDGKAMWFMPPYPDPKPPLERTGAGDSFASALTSFLALELPLEEALLRAPINSMSVVQYVGAQKGLLTREKIEEYLKKAPSNYRPAKIG
ncbi:MAG: carbohydrate kinase family protein [Patescibacteria group bacterium]